MASNWDSNLALIWTKMVGPSRPTISEMAVYTRYAHKLMLKNNEKLRILILGSTPEFRDWGFEENMDVWVMDANFDYHNNINRELRHKTILTEKKYKEHLIIDKWQNLNIENYFDIIIGDLVIGNIPPSELENSLYRISRALKNNGLFLGKSFFFPNDYKQNDWTKILDNYYSSYPYHPYSYFTFYLTMDCLDENHMLNFNRQYKKVLQLYQDGLMKEETFGYFKNLGWEKEMEFEFHVPTIKTYEKLLKKFFKIEAIEYSEDIYSPYFPLYIATKERSA